MSQEILGNANRTTKNEEIKINGDFLDRIIHFRTFSN